MLVKKSERCSFDLVPFMSAHVKNKICYSYKVKYNDE